MRKIQAHFFISIFLGKKTFIQNVKFFIQNEIFERCIFPHKFGKLFPSRVFYRVQLLRKFYIPLKFNKIVHLLKRLMIRNLKITRPPSKGTKIVVTKFSTIDTAIYSKICVLNFEDAIKSGGYINGHNVQAEYLCRQILLYPARKNEDNAQQI